MYFTYIIYSKKRDMYYVGYTSDIKKRMERHNLGNSKSTKSGIPWELVYYETFEDKSDAIKRESEIKRKKSRKYIHSLISKK